MTENCATWTLEYQRRVWELLTELVQKADDGGENLVHLLTADVGHTDSEIVYEENKLELHRYAPDEVTRETPIFVVYALVNRPYVLDLQPDRSVIRRLMDAGFEVYLLKWGEPSTLDRYLTMEDYVCRYLENCLDAACAESGVDQVHLLGYCMGGTMAIMHAARDQFRLRTLSLMATPVAFDDTGGILERWSTHFDPDVVVDAIGNLPADVLALEFSMMDPIEHYLGKYLTLYENLEDEAFVKTFARMERWIWDGVDVAGEAYREFISEIYQDNALIRGEYDLGGEPVDLSEIDVPVLSIVGEYDHIVPPASSEPVHDAIASEDDRLLEFSAGHIGISVSSKAHEHLWPEVCDWLAARDGRPGADEARADRSDGRGADDPPADLGESDDLGDATSSVKRVAETAAASLRGDGAGRAAEESSKSVETVDGIGPTYGERLAGAGIGTVADLRECEPAELAEVTGAPRSRVERWLERVD